MKSAGKYDSGASSVRLPTRIIVFITKGLDTNIKEVGGHVLFCLFLKSRSDCFWKPGQGLSIFFVLQIQILSDL